MMFLKLVLLLTFQPQSTMPWFLKTLESTISTLFLILLSSWLKIIINLISIMDILDLWLNSVLKILMLHNLSPKGKKIRNFPKKINRKSHQLINLVTMEHMQPTIHLVEEISQEQEIFQDNHKWEIWWVCLEWMDIKVEGKILHMNKWWEKWV